MLTNYHSHTQYCDGRATIEEFIGRAIEVGFSAWGVSPHCPLPMLKHAPWAMKIDHVDSYIAEVSTLKKKYAPKIRVLCGMEIDYIDSEFNPSIEYFQGLPLDYRIGSVHLLRSPVDGEILDVDCEVKRFSRMVEMHYGGSLQRIVEAYYRSMRELVEVRGFDFIAHSDKIHSNASQLSSKIAQKSWYKDLVEEFLCHCATHSTVIEINTKAYASRGTFYPSQDYFKRIAELQIPVIINSDAHRLEFVSSGIEEAHRLFKGTIITL